MGLMEHACDDPMCRRCIREQPERRFICANDPRDPAWQAWNAGRQRAEEQPERRCGGTHPDNFPDHLWHKRGSIPYCLRCGHEPVSSAAPFAECGNPKCVTCANHRLTNFFVGPPMATQPTAAMDGLTLLTPREVAEAKVQCLLDEDAPTRALAFTMLRNQGMDTDTARRILRDAKWNLP